MEKIAKHAMPFFLSKRQTPRQNQTDFNINHWCPSGATVVHPVTEPSQLELCFSAPMLKQRNRIHNADVNEALVILVSSVF